jgi:tRNA-specific 2-thiouridylase
VGRHGGLWRYTQGQRRGLGIAHSEPLYVLDKDVEANRLIVGPRRMLGAVGCECGGVNLLVPVAHWPERVLVQTRYRQQAREARITLEEGRMAVRFAEPRDRPAPGQVCAVYGGPGSALEGVVLAGAVIRGILEEGGA